MQLVVNVLGVFLIVVCVASALGDFARVPSLVETMNRLGISTKMLPVLGLIKMLGALGVGIGFVQSAFAIAMGACLSVYFAGAVVAHSRVRDPFRESAAAYFILIAALTYLLTALAV
jgi:hypothetical protein